MLEQTNILKAIETIVEEKTKDFATKQDIVEFKDEILTNIDVNNKKLDQILTEHPAMNGAIDENRGNIEKHDKRIKKLEASSAPA